MVLDPHRFDKFSPYYYGPFQVMQQMNNHHYLLKNDSGYLGRLVPRFHLKIIPPPTDASYQVDHLLDFKLQNNKPYYLIKWKGYPNPTWEPKSNIDDPSLITRFHELNP